jgi:hypothetical protein
MCTTTLVIAVRSRSREESDKEGCHASKEQ